MIKNIVFDIGNVLLNFKPREYMKLLRFDEQTIDIIEHMIFKSNWWSEIDKGTITTKELAQILIKENPNYKESIKKVLNENWVEIHTQKEDSIDFLKDLKTKGLNIYLLSNCSKEAHNFIMQYDFTKLIDGGVYSYELNICKPEKEIYQHLIKKFNINPEESIFIDDNEVNVKTSCELGFNGVVFTQLNDVKEYVNKKLFI